MSSILNYFKRKAPQDVGEFLPDPTESSSSISERSITLTNDEVRPLTEPKPKWRKTEQHTYCEKTRADIGKYPTTKKPAAAACMFTKRLGHPVPESTVRKFCNLYLIELDKQHQSTSTSEVPRVMSFPFKNPWMSINTERVRLSSNGIHTQAE